jgi:transcriptional regulator with XRE-family HTH domain
MTISIAGNRLRAARSLLGWTIEELGRRASVSPPRVAAIEAGKDALASTIARLVTTLEREGVRFSHDGSINLEPKSEKFTAVGDPDAETIRKAKAIVSAAAKYRRPVGGLG